MRHALMMAALATMMTGGVEAGVLDRVHDTAALTLGYRVDATPFSYKNKAGDPAGYSIELCRAVAAEVKSQLSLPDLQLHFAEVTAENRFDALSSGRVDILCGPETETLARRQTVDFSLMTFATGMTLLYRIDGPKNFGELDGKKVGALNGTTTIALIQSALQANAIKADLVAVPSYDEGLRRLTSGEFSAFFGDGAILLYRWLQSPDRAKLKLSDRMFSHEPYALALPKGDNDFRLVVDRALAKLYRTGEINSVFKASFGNEANPSDLVKAMYLLNALPE